MVPYTTTRQQPEVPALAPLQRKSPAKLKRHPAAYASAYTPTGTRRRCMVVYRCPFCESGHHGFVWDLDDALGPRRARCGGGTVWLVIARVYRPATAPEEAAA
jgi:hypothetical protein